jgi:internalin A
MRARLTLVVFGLLAGCGGGGAGRDNPDAQAGCPAGQHSSNGECVPDGTFDAGLDAPVDVPPTEAFASVCTEHLDDPGMQAFVLEWSTLGIAGCEGIGEFLATQTSLAFTFSATRSVDPSGRLRFRPWRINNTVIAALATQHQLGALVLEDQPSITDLSPLGKLPALSLLRVAGCGAHNFSFVHELALASLQIRNERVDSLAPLAGETQLTELVLVDTGNADLSVTAGLVQLSSLIVNKNAVVSAAPLAGLTELTQLSLDDNGITDLAPLAGLTKLVELSFRNNAVSSVAPLANLRKLETLALSNNRVTDLAPIAGLTGLTSLAIDQNAIASFAPLRDLVELTALNLNRTGLTSLAAIATNTKIVSLFISDNPVTDLAALTQLAPLRVLAAERLTRGNTPFDVATVATLTQLRSLAISGDKLTDLAVVGGMVDLEALVAAGNAIVDVAPAGRLAKLTRLELNLNLIKNLDALAPLERLTTFVVSDNPIDAEHCPVAPVAKSAVLSKFCASL